MARKHSKATIRSRSFKPHGSPARPKQWAFQSDIEEASTDWRAPPALIINPRADPAAIALAALERCGRLEDSLRCWMMVYDSEIEAGELAATLYPLIKEARMLVEHLRFSTARSRRPHVPHLRGPAGNTV